MASSNTERMVSGIASELWQQRNISKENGNPVGMGFPFLALEKEFSGVLALFQKMWYTNREYSSDENVKGW